jgi:hypothetical protein
MAARRHAAYTDLVSGAPPYAAFLAVLWLVALLPAGYFGYRQAAENAIVHDYLAHNGLADLPLTKASAVRISQQVRADFQTDEHRFNALDMRKRPFLREDTAFLLRHKEGLCGEGTRVLVNLLLHAGYDASRITLFDRELRSFHTLVSVKLAGHEFLLDSINTPRSINAFLNERDVSVAAFRVAAYSDDLAVRRASARQAVTALEHPFVARVSAYSYDAVPYTKLFSALGISVRMFNFERPAPIVSAIAERPNLLLALLALLAGTFAMVILQASGACRGLHRVLTREGKVGEGKVLRSSRRGTS